MNEVRLGIIGVGGMGTFHANNIKNKNVNKIKLTAVCDINPDKLKPFSNIRTFSRSIDLIESGEVDAVLIATPHYAHTTIGIEALNAGLHVLVEKPISVHKADCERLIKAHKNKKQVFQAMLQQRVKPRFNKIKQLIDNGSLGRLLRVNWTVTDWFRSDTYYLSSSWRATWKGEGGGVLMNQAPHNLDMFQWLFGMPSKVKAFCKFGKYHNIEVEDDVTAYMEYDNGMTATFITATGEAPGINRLEIQAEMGNLICEYENDLKFVRNEISSTKFLRVSEESFATPNTWNVTIPTRSSSNEHATVMQNFVNAILHGERVITPAEEGMNSVELANAMILSTLKDKTIELPLKSSEYEKVLKVLISRSKPIGIKRKKMKSSADLSKSFK